MKVYFSYSARGQDEYGSNYSKINQIIENHGHTLLVDQDNNSEKYYKSSHQDLVAMYKRAMKFIRECDVVVLEVSMHSLSMGYFMQAALSMGKPVIALYVKGCYPAFAIGIENEKLQVIEYSMDNLVSVLEISLEYAQETSDIRFNFFVTPTISSYLDWVAKEKKLPRSVYLRRLIEDDMGQNDDFGDT